MEMHKLYFSSSSILYSLHMNIYRYVYSMKYSSYLEHYARMCCLMCIPVYILLYVEPKFFFTEKLCYREKHYQCV